MAGTIIPQANGKYKLTFMKHRQRYYKTVSANDEAEAQKLLDLFIQFVDKAIDLNIDICTFSDFCTLYFKDYAPGLLAEECVYNYYRALQNWVLPKIGNVPLSKCTKKLFTDYFSWLSKQISPVTGNNLSIGSREKIYAIMSSVLSCAVQWKVLSSNPIYQARPEEFKRKNRTPVTKTKQRTLTLEESRTLIKALEDVDLKYQLITHFALIGGLRRSEILGLKWSDINFKEMYATINQSSIYVPKKGYVVGDLKNETSNRTLSLPRTTMLLLIELQMQSKGSDKDFIFVNNRGRRKGLRMNPNSVTAWFREFRKKINLPQDVPLHGLRHTNATLLITKGINVKNVSTRLGHSNTGTTLNVYAQAIAGVDKTAGETLDKILFKRQKVFKIKRKKKEEIIQSPTF